MFAFGRKAGIVHCLQLTALAGEGGYTSMDIPHNTTWEIKGQ
jgi:hypothetical protein